MNTVALIPAYKPDDKMVTLVKELKEKDFDILVVDDGSGEEYADLFRQAEEYAVVIHNPHNMGKGATLKNGMRVLRETYPEATHFITADSDGQHLVKDICRVREKLEEGSNFVLTMRGLKGNVPLRSRFGNSLSRIVFAMLTGHYLQDNQSGLRGFKVEYISWLVNVEGDKYDYEMNVLMFIDRQKIKVTEVPIDTVYLDGNSSSHFNPVKDTIRIYKKMFKTAAATLISFANIQLCLILITIFIGWDGWLRTVPMVYMLSAMVCWFFNKFFIFRRVHYQITGRFFLFAAIRFTIVMSICVPFKLLGLPLIIAHNIAIILAAPIEYFLLKLIKPGSWRR